MNPGDSPAGIHGWMAYLETLAIEAAHKGTCNGELVLMGRARFPSFRPDLPEVRTALELYRDHEEPVVRLTARAWLARTQDEALGLLVLPQDRCADVLRWLVEHRIQSLIQQHGEEADPVRHRALFAAAKAKKLRPPLKVWGPFAYVEIGGGCVVYPDLLVELEGVWLHPDEVMRLAPR